MGLDLTALNNAGQPRGNFRYNPSIKPAVDNSIDLSALFNIDQGINPLGFLAGIPAITNLINYGKDTQLPFDAGDITAFGQGAKQQVHSNIDFAKQNILSNLYGKGLYKSGSPVGDVANLEGQRGNLLSNVDDQLAGLMMSLNQMQLQSGLAQKQRQGDVGELFTNLAMVLPFIL